MKQPDVRLKVTRSGKGILILVPIPSLGVTLNFITSKKYLEMLMEGSLRKDMMACKYLGESRIDQFLTKDEKEEIEAGTVHIQNFSADDPMSAKAQKERRDGAVKITDDW